MAKPNAKAMKAKPSFIAKAVEALKNPYASVASNGIIYDPKKWFDLGCYVLNAQISGSIYKGIPDNMSIMLAGETGVGKTFLTLGALASIQKQERDAEAIIFESEGAIKTVTLVSHGCDLPRTAMVPVLTIEDFTNQVVSTMQTYEATPEKDRPQLVFALDSLGLLPPAKEAKDVNEGKNASDMGLAAKAIKRAFRNIRLRVGGLGRIPFIITLHIYAKQGTYVPTNDIAGGQGPKYAGDTILLITKSQVKEGEDGYDKGGTRVKCVAWKSRDTRQRTAIEFVIDFAKGVTKYSGLFEFCEKHKLIEKVGNRYRFGEGEPKFRKEIYSNPEGFFTKEVLDQIDVFCGKYFNYGESLIDIPLEDLGIDDNTAAALAEAEAALSADGDE